MPDQNEFIDALNEAIVEIRQEHPKLARALAVARDQTSRYGMTDAEMKALDEMVERAIRNSGRWPRGQKLAAFFGGALLGGAELIVLIHTIATWR